MRVDCLSVSAHPGSYALELYLPAAAPMRVGRIGTIDFPKGMYLYFGSANGPGGLQARLMRHLRPAELKRLHWHIDALRSIAVVVAVAWIVDPPTPDGDRAEITVECGWSKAAAGMPDAWIPAVGFGSSDCRQGCLAHLVGFPGVESQLACPELVTALAAAIKVPVGRIHRVVIPKA